MTGTPTDTVVSEARRVLTECLDAFDDEVAEALMGGSERADSWPDIDVPVEALRTLLAIDRRTATPQSGGVVVKGLEWHRHQRDDIERHSANMSLADHIITWTASGYDLYIGAWGSGAEPRLGPFATLDEAKAVAEANWQARIRSTLADPIPEAPADEEVEGLAQALRNLAEGAEQEDRTILYKAAAALRRSTETDKPGVREAAQRIVDALDAPDSVMGGIATVLDIADVSTIARALSASPLTEEQPTHRHKKRGTEYVLIGIGRMQAEEWVHTHREKATDPIVTSVDMREVAIYRSATDPTEIWVRPREEFEDGRFEPLPRSTTGGAK